MHRHRLLPLVGWLATLAAGATFLVLVSGALPPLPASVADLHATYDRDGVAMLALTLLRPVALAAVVFQFVVALAAVVAALTSSVALLRFTRRAPGSMTRRLVRHAVGAGLTATAVTSLAPAAAMAQTTAPPAGGEPAVTAPDVTTTAATGPTITSSGEPIVMVRLPTVDPGPNPLTAQASDETPDNAAVGSAVMISLDAGSDGTTSTADPDGTHPGPADQVGGDDDAAIDAAPPSSSTRPLATDVPVPAPASSMPADTPSVASPPAFAADDHTEGTGTPAGETVAEAGSPEDTWRIEAGDHLWAIAEETLADAWDTPPSDDDVLGYWGALLDANRERLVDPSNPDLIFPGQELVLPPIPVGAVAPTAG